MVKKYLFSISTNIVGSEEKEQIELELPDDCTEQEIEELGVEEYLEWLHEKNRGGFEEID